MLVEMDSSMLSALIRGSDLAYEIMDHPLIKSKGYYIGAHHDKWVWNSHFSGTEQQLWETYQLLKNPSQYVSRYKPCSANDLYTKLYAVGGVEWVNIKDNYDFSVEITVEGGADADIAEVLHDNLMICIRTVGDYRIEKTYPSHTVGYSIYRKIK